MQFGNDILFTAPGPDPIPDATTEIVGPLGSSLYVYWIVSHFPIGSVVSGPFPRPSAPDRLSESNYVRISWLPTPGASSYDLLVTRDLRMPMRPGNFALATGLTSTSFRDEGDPVEFYDLTGVPLGAPQNEHIFFDNRDAKQPTLRFIPWPIEVSSIIFEDGTEQNTAGGGGGGGGPAGANTQIQFNNNGAFGASPNLIWSNTDNRFAITQPSIVSPSGTPPFEINFAGFTSLRMGIQRVFGETAWIQAFAIDGSPSGLKLNELGGGITVGNVNVPTNGGLGVFGDVDITGVYRINGVPIGGGGGQNQTPWLSNIDGANFQLNNPSAIGIGANVTAAPFAGASLFIKAGATNFPVQIEQDDSTRNSSIVLLNNFGQNLTLQVYGSASNPANPERMSLNAGTAFAMNSGGDIIFKTLNTERMRISTAVAIGSDGSQSLSDQFTINLLVGPNSSGGASVGRIMVSANTITPSNATIGSIDFANLTTTTQTVVARIASITDGSLDSSAFEFSTSNLGVITPRMIITANGNVGVGLFSVDTPPLYILDVKGDVNITGTYRVNGVPIGGGGGATPPAGTNGQVQWNNAGAFGASANLVWDNTNSRLGIATAAPNYPLTIGGGIGPKITFVPGSDYGFGIGPSMLQIFTASSGTRVAIGYGTSTALTETMSVINTTVGIGNDGSLPTNAITDYPTLIVGPTASSSVIGLIALCTNVISTVDTVGSLRFANYAITAADKRIAQINANSDGTIDSGSLSFWTWASGVAGERMRITSAGNVGVGIGNPAYPLTIHNDAPASPSLTASTGYFAIWNNSGLQLAMGTDGASGWAQVKFSGNDGRAFPLLLNPLGGDVGIGTESPAAPLDVNGNASGDQLRVGSGSGFQYKIGRDGNDGLLDFQGTQSGFAGYRFMNPAGETQLVILTSGNVGIINSNPAYALDVIGDVNVTGVYRINGVPLAAGASGPTVMTRPGKIVGTIYQNTTGKPLYVVATVIMPIALPQAEVVVYCDANPSPSTEILRFQIAEQTSFPFYLPLSFIVLPGYYYLAVGSATTQEWTEWY